MQQVTKRQQANRTYFREQVEKFLESLGAVRDERTLYPYNLPTRLGMLGIHPYDTWVACRWDDIPRALQTIGPECMNRYSGKWNHHYEWPMFNSRRGAQLAVEDFCSQLGKYLLPESQGGSQPSEVIAAFHQASDLPTSPCAPHSREEALQEVGDAGDPRAAAGMQKTTRIHEGDHW